MGLGEQLNRAIFGNKKPPVKTNIAPMQKIDISQGQPITTQLVPELQTNQGNIDRLTAQKKLGFTPSFTNNLVNSAPYVGKPLSSSALSNSAGAGAEFLKNKQPNQIVLQNNKFGQDPSTVLHEGLHRIYASNPQVRKEFINDYNKSASPGLKQWLSMRLYGYKGASRGLDEGGVPIPNYNINDLNTLPPNLQDEAHSFLSEVPTMGGKLPASLDNYYSQYYNTHKSLKNR